MLTIGITGMAELQATLKDFSHCRLAATVATALTRTAVKVRAEMLTKVQQTFDRPTPYTLRQLRYVADWLGIDDGSPQLAWRYAQRRGATGIYAAEVHVEWVAT